MKEILDAASAVVGGPLTGSYSLGGSGRSTVLRCRTAAGGTVVVKAYPLTAEGAESFAAEAAGLAFTSDTGAGPRLLGTASQLLLIVMSDLGDAPSLADLLLGGSAAQARAALLSWSVACGKLAALTAGRQQELASLRAAYDSPGQRAEHWLGQRVQAAPDLIGLLDLVPPAGLADDLAEVQTILEPACYPVFSPGDICPDNNLLTASGLRFVDYESAEFHSAFLDAAYLRMPFSTCWCVFRLPADLAGRAEAAYRAEVCEIYPELADDAVWRPGLRRAVAAWTSHCMTYLLDRSIVSDRPMEDSRAPVPTARQLLRYRWRQLADELESAAELPALASVMRELLAATAKSWPVPDLPGYPAFLAGAPAAS